MKRILTIAMVGLVAALGAVGVSAEEELASVRAGEVAAGDWSTRAAFETAEVRWDATVRIEGPGTLTLCYPGDGRMALKSVVGPTEGPQQISLHMRANPDADGDPRELRVTWRFEAGEERATCWLTPAGGAPMPDSFALQPEPLYQHRIPRVTEPPVIDGDLSDACWDEAAYIGDAKWRMYNEPRDAKMATVVWCAYDDENLYAAFRCETPDVGKLVANVTERDGYAWRDDSAEIFFDIGHDHTTYYEYIVTPKGVVFDSKWFNEGGAWLTDWDYIGEWKTSVEPGAWIVEIRLALESYEKRDLRGNPTGEMPLPTGDVAGILFSRNDRVVGEGMSHADNAPSFHEVHQYGHLVGFRPNRVEAYRKTALREVERLERRWRDIYLSAGSPPLTVADGACPVGTAGLPEAITDLRTQALAPAPEFDEWVAINAEIEIIDAWLDRARALLAPMTAAQRRPDRENARKPWGIAVADPTEPGALPASSSTLHVPRRIEVSGARGEAVPVQLVLLPHRGASEVTLLPRALSGARGALDAARWYEVTDEGRLIPNASVTLDEPRHIWWEVEIPRDAEAGAYEGMIVTTDGSSTVSLPVRLTVHDFTLPITPSLAVSVGFDGQHVTEQWYEERSPLGAGEYWPYAQALLEHGLVPREMLADFTWWGDGEIDLGGANRMMIRAWDYAPAMRAMIAARPAHLKGLQDPARALRRAAGHWADVTEVHPIRTYLPADEPIALAGPGLRANSVAVALPGMATEQIAEIGTWAVAPEIAAGFGGCEGAALSAAAGEAEAAKAWRIDHIPGLMHTRMLGWLADDYRRDLIFWDAPDAEGLCASGLLWCETADGERLVEPHPTVALKLLRQAVQDYEYLRILRGVHSETAPHGIPDRLWRLRLAQDTQFRRNWDMVMNVRDFNRDPEYLAERRDEVAKQILRGRGWLQRVADEGSLPGDR
ncbi:MAG: sugar-binding protein [Armatimonadota bacterium]